jgi:hypothetical protein
MNNKILKMVAKSKEGSNVINNYLELAKRGKADYQPKTSGKPKTQAQEENKIPTAKEKAEADMASRKTSSNNAIMNSSAQNKANTAIKNGLSGNELFSYDFTDADLVKGIIFSELLGQPKCRRRGKSYRSRRAR